MGKRVDHDATQDVSASQLVPDAKPPGYPSVPKNDASMWMQSPVSADDFMGAGKKPKPKKKPASPDAGARRLVIGLIALFFLATVGLGGYWAFLRGTPQRASVMPTATTLPPPATPPLATTVVDAAVATAPADAGVPDAAVAAGLAVLEVDAISGADPAPKKSKKRPTTKKKTAKKKSATARKRR